MRLLAVIKGRRTYSRVETAHVPVRNTASIDDVLRYHRITAGLGLLFVDRVGLEPVVVGDDAKLDLAAHHEPNAAVQMTVSSAQSRISRTHYLNSSVKGTSLRRT